MTLCRWHGLGASAAAALALILALGGPALAAEVPVPRLKARVTDLTGTLDAPQLQALESRLAAFEQKKGSQIAVLMLPSTKPETIEQYSIRVAEEWKIGRTGTDDGLVLVIAKDDHKLRIEVGRGLEGAIPDVIAKRVIREVIAPHFLNGDFNGGIADGVAALTRLIEGEPLPPPKQGRSSVSDLEGLLAPLLVASVLLGAFLSKVFGRFFGAAATAGVVGIAAWAVLGALLAAVLAATVAFVVSLLLGAGGFARARWASGGWPAGGSGGWSGGGSGGFSGGGGDFGGGGASGEW